MIVGNFLELPADTRSPFSLVIGVEEEYLPWFGRLSTVMITGEEEEEEEEGCDFLFCVPPGNGGGAGIRRA